MNDLQRKMFNSMRRVLLERGLTWEKLRTMTPEAVEGTYWTLLKASGAPVEITEEEIRYHG